MVAVDSWRPSGVRSQDFSKNWSADKFRDFHYQTNWGSCIPVSHIAMPNLRLFAACEKVIVDESGLASLISLAQEVTVFHKRGTSPAKNAVGPQQWCIFSLWNQSPGDAGKTFVQVIQILWPDKTEFKTHRQLFTFTHDKPHQLSINITGFPIGQVGPVAVNMWLEIDSQRVTDTFSWIVSLKHEEQAASQ